MAAETVRNVEQIDVPLSKDNEASDTADETPTESSATSIPGINNEDTTSDQNSTDDDFITPVKSFLQSGCDCHYRKTQSACTNSLDFDEVVEHRMQCIKLSSVELDLVILRALQSHVMCHRMTYFFRGVEVCKKTSLFVYGIGKSRLESLKADYKRQGIVPRTLHDCLKTPLIMKSWTELSHL